MAEATGLRNNALPYPIYGAPWTVVVPIFDADGDLVVGAAGLDSEVSKNGDTFADCTNEATQIATDSGMYYLTLTGTEMTADVVAVIVKTSTSGAKTTPIVLYPKKLVTIRSGTSAGGDTAYITLDGSASAVDDFYNGMLVVATIDTVVEARIIADYTGSNQRAAVTPAWNTAPDADDTFVIYLPDGVQLKQANLTHIAGALVSTTTAQLGVNAVQISGDGTAADNLETMLDGTGGQTLSLKSLVINNAAGIAVDIDGSTYGMTVTGTANEGVLVVGNGVNTPGIKLQGNGSGAGMLCLGGDTGPGLKAEGGATSGPGLYATGGANGDGITANGTDAGYDIQGNLVGSVQSVAAGGIAATAFAAGAINAAAIADGAIDAATFAAGAITAAAIATGAIDADAIADNAIDAGAIAADAITAAKIADGAIDAATFAAGAITAAAIAADAVGASELAADAVAEIADAIWDEARSGHATIGTFGESFNGVVSGTAITGTLSTTQLTTNLTEATDDHYNGRVIIFITGVLAGQGTAITDYTGATKLLTVVAMTEAPGNGDDFVIV